MAQTLVRFETPVRAESGTLYNATACGRELESRGWEGWIEFENERAGEVLRSARETTQPNLTAITYWATGLTNVYLEGALNRILRPPVHKEPHPAAPPIFDGPAARPVTPAGQPRDAILNPFSVYRKSPDLLAQELTALRGWHLRQIIRDYDLVEHADQRLEALTEAELASLIVQGVRDASDRPD